MNTLAPREPAMGTTSALWVNYVSADTPPVGKE